MNITFGSILTCILIILILTVYLELLLKAKTEFYLTNIRFAFVIVVLLTVRSTLPFNFPFTITIPIRDVIADVSIFFSRTVIWKFTLIEYIVMIWLAGAIFNIVRYVLHQYTERKLLVQAAMVDHPYKEEIQDIIREFEIENFKIAILPGSISPAISGIRSPIFVFPDYKFSSSDLRYILKHEIIHYQKHDAVLKLFLDLCVCTFWWNPLLYICRRNFLLSIEIANDMWLIRDLTEEDKLAYATCLLDNGKRCYLEATRNVSIALIHKRSDLKLRIMKILQKEKRSSRLKYLCHNIFLVLLLITGCIFVGESYYIPPEVEAKTFSIDEENSYLVQTENGYDIYISDTFVGTVKEISDELESLPVYKETKE